MAKLIWDAPEDRIFETGVEHGVLYVLDPVTGIYGTGVAWNGLTSVTDTPSGGESNPQYADNLKYLELRSPEEKTISVEAFTYPDEFAACDGSAQPKPGIFVGQQKRTQFGFSWVSKKGNAALGEDFGFIVHVAYGCTATPSEKAYATINDSPEAATMSWEFDTTKVPVTGHKPASYLKFDSTSAPALGMTALLDQLHGAAAGTGPKLLPPDELIALFV